MIVLITDHAVRLEDADNFSGLKVLIAGQDMAAFGERLSGAGYFDETQSHLFVKPEWLEQAGPQTEDRRQQLSGMLAFARNKGWVDSKGNIGPHIETKT